MVDRLLVGREPDGEHAITDRDIDALPAYGQAPARDPLASVPLELKRLL